MEKGTVNERLIDLFFQMSRFMRKEMSTSSRVAHLSMLQLEVLIYLKVNTSTEMHTIASYFHINKSTASNHLDTLQKMKLVSRKIDTKDKRVVHVILTVKGKKLLAEGLKEKNRRMNNLLTYLSKEDKNTLCKIITNLLNSMKKQHEK